MNIVKFARLISYITSFSTIIPDEYQIEDIQNMIKELVPNCVNETDVQLLMAEMNNPTGIIPAIKAYRVLTGADLKEAKNAVEKHRRIVSNAS